MVLFKCLQKCFCLLFCFYIVSDGVFGCETKAKKAIHLDVEKLISGEQKSDLVKFTKKSVKKSAILLEKNNDPESDFIYRPATGELAQQIVCLRDFSLKTEPDDLTELFLSIPGEIKGQGVVLGPRAFEGLKSGKIRVHLQFITKNGKKVFMPSSAGFMFQNASAICSIDFKGIDTSKINSMIGMFEGCLNLTKLDLSSFKIHKDIYDDFADGCFHNCPNLGKVDISSFPDRFKASEMTFYMFHKYEPVEKRFDLISRGIIGDKRYVPHELQGELENWIRYGNNCDIITVHKQDTGAATKELIKLQSSIQKGTLKQAEQKVTSNSSLSVAVADEFDDKRNELNQIYWRIVANNRLNDANLGKDYSWIQDEEYYESIIKVIGEAIGDCVTGANEFAKPTEDGLIVFEASPENYQGEHWNAVVLYNLVESAKKAIQYDSVKRYYGYTEKKYKKLSSDKSCFNEIENDMIDYYVDLYQKKGLNDKIDELKGLIHDAVDDIKHYSDALQLWETLAEVMDVACKYDMFRRPEGRVAEMRKTDKQIQYFLKDIEHEIQIRTKYLEKLIRDLEGSENQKDIEAKKSYEEMNKALNDLYTSIFNKYSNTLQFQPDRELVAQNLVTMEFLAELKQKCTELAKIKADIANNSLIQEYDKKFPAATAPNIVFTTEEAISERKRAFEPTDPRKSIVPHIEIGTMLNTRQKKNTPIFKIHPGIESQYGAYEGYKKYKKYILPALAIENKKLCLHHLVEEVPLSKADSLNPYSISIGKEYYMLDKNKRTCRILYQDTKVEQINKIYDFYYNLLDGLIETSK